MTSTLTLYRFSLTTCSTVVSRRCFSATWLRQSGHNKWSKIKHTKGAQDSKRSLIYAQAARDITAAVRSGGNTDPALNVSLALTIAKAKKLGIPKDNIDAAIRRASGADSKDALQDVTYEAFGPGGVACLIDCMTDNPTRTHARVKEMVNKYGGRMADVKYLFKAKSVLRLTAGEDRTFEDVFDMAVEGGAEDVVQEGDEIEITAPPSLLHSLANALSPKTNLLFSEIVQLPSTPPPDEPLDDDILQRLEEFEEGLEQNADCVRLWRAA